MTSASSNSVLCNSASSSSASAWHGNLQLQFTRRQNKTILQRSYAEAPFKVQRPFYPEGAEVCHTVILHTAGGMVGGDRLSSTIQLDAQTQALVTTAAAAKVYRSNGEQAVQMTQIHLAEATCLEWLPQETIVFNGASYRQSLRVELAPAATWMGWEITRLGRTARSEQFRSGVWQSHTEVWQGDRLLWVDPQQIQGDRDLIDSPYGLNGCSVVASFAYVGQPVSPELVTRARSYWTTGAADVGVTRLIAGLLCRYRGHSTVEARRWFIQVWHLLRLAQFQRSGCLPRVWQW